MEPNSVPSSAALTDDTMLPYNLWRVADLIDGKRTVEAIASAVGLDLPSAMRALQDIEQELGSSLVGAPGAVSEVTVVTSAEVVDAIAATAVDLMGPMGEVIVEDAFDEVGDEAPAIELISRVVDELREPVRTTFIVKLRAKGLLQ